MSRLSAGGREAATRAERPRTRISGPFVPVFLACLALHLVWAFAMPIASGEDEPAHIYRALSLWNGVLVPQDHSPDGTWLVQVPRSVATYAESTSCTRSFPDVPASCGGPTTSASGGTVTARTGAGRYFPLYYYVVGAPGHLDAGVTGFYAMRIVSLLVASVLLALAVTTVLRAVGVRWACLVLPIAITPQVLWLGSVVNPNAWELDAGLLTWAAGLALVSRSSPDTLRVLRAKFAVGATVLVLMRRLSPLWLALIVAGVAAVWMCLPSEERRDPKLLISRRTAAQFAVLSGLAALSAWWHLTLDVGAVAGMWAPQPDTGGFLETLEAMLPNAVSWVKQTFGLFGWVDTPTPGLAVLTWLTLGCMVFVLVVVGSRHRVRVALVITTCAALTVVIPLAFQLTVGRQIGIHFWQARYTMPFGQGIPLALGFLGAAWRGQPRELSSLLRVGRPVALLSWPVLGTVAFAWALHRYVKGDGADWSLGSLAWTPPGGIGLVLGAYVAAAVALTWSLRDHPTTREREVGA